MTLDRRDHRLVEQHPRWTHRAGTVGVVARRADRAEVEACAEIPRAAGQDRDTRVRIVREGGEGFAQGDCGRGIDGAPFFGAVDGDDRHRAVAVDQHCHDSLPGSIIRCLSGLT